jgi:hypothetical protein
VTTQDLEEGGGFGTREYAGVVVVAATWEWAIELLAQERDTLSAIAARAADEHEFDQLAKEEDLMLSDPDEGLVAAPDFGMFAICVSLCAAGCATAASCRGHPESSAWSSHPLVLLTADRPRARILEELARTAKCGLANTENERLALWAQSIEDMIDLAALLVENRRRFDSLPLPAALRKARGIEAPATAKHSHTPPPGQSTLF